MINSRSSQYYPSMCSNVFRCLFVSLETKLWNIQIRTGYCVRHEVIIRCLYCHVIVCNGYSVRMFCWHDRKQWSTQSCFTGTNPSIKTMSQPLMNDNELIIKAEPFPIASVLNNARYSSSQLSRARSEWIHCECEKDHFLLGNTNHYPLEIIHLECIIVVQGFISIYIY